MYRNGGKECIGTYGYSSVGAVIGATYPQQAARIRETHPHNFLYLFRDMGRRGQCGRTAAEF